ncbi:MAG: helix-hairpin-helix domain-containing protein [Caldilineaceae bacterium]
MVSPIHHRPLLTTNRATLRQLPSACPSQEEPPKPPAVIIDKLEPLPKEPSPAPIAEPAESAPSAAASPKPAPPAAIGVISGGAASRTALSNVPAPAQAAPVETAAAAPAPAQPAPSKALGKSDRLQTINGIGPVYEKKLKAAGVQTFADLARQTPEKVVEIIAPQSWQNIDAAAWIAQAAELANA